MKSFKLIIVFVFSIVLGNHIGYSQNKNAKNAEEYIPKEVVSRTKSSPGFSKQKMSKTNRANGLERDAIFSDKEKNARALTAQKSKKSGKAKLTKEQARKRREERVRAIKEENKRKKKTPSKRNKQ
ncbi:hypothetical protein [uncultured Aquimarina sp.]|uniref:hypothetical protein n=1 Tax=uncultured Aquimarina sp. TaxID=575652 RepID=UPI00261D6520|nr:hypothetical protein [uncultured Aquimarina sp.]